MNNVFILQNLCDAFEVLKDSWTSKSEAICKCIEETAKYDMSTALDMWLYLLQSHKKDLKRDLGAEIVKKVCDRFYYSYDDHYKDAVSYICPILINKPELYIILYGEVIIKDNYDQPAFLTYSFAWFLTENNPNILLEILHLYNNNSYKEEFSIGSFMSKTVEAYKEIQEKYERSIYDANKEVLMSFLENIKDRRERAECMVAILSL